MLLYQPTEAEIVAVLSRAASRAPSLRFRLNRAGDLLRAGALHVEQGEWRCCSAGDPNADPADPPHVYRVDFGACDCPDCRSGRAVVGGVSFCKHLLALQALRRILLDHLRRRLIGNLPDPGMKEEARRAANAALLLSPGADPQHPALFAFADARNLRPRCICSLYSNGGDLAFASETHMGAFAEWLGRAQELPAELEALVLYRRLRALGVDDEEAADAADAVVDSVPAPLRMAA